MVPFKKVTVLIHGYGFDSRIWNPVELAFEGHSVVYKTIPGFDSTSLTESYTINELAKNIWDQLDESTFGQINLVGHSMGGYVAMEMASLHPSRISSLVLIHSHVFADTEEKKKSRTAVMNDILDNGREGFINRLVPSLFADKVLSEEVIRKLISRGLRYDDHAWYFGTQAMRDRIDHSETLKKIAVPVMMIMGRKDAAVPLDIVYVQASMAERTTLHIYPEVGHMGMYENPRLMTNDIIHFYDGLQK